MATQTRDFKFRNINAELAYELVAIQLQEELTFIWAAIAPGQAEISKLLLHQVCNFLQPVATGPNFGQARQFASGCARKDSMPLPHTEAAGRLQAELGARGVRMTRQRRTILSVIETARQHLDASQILRRARKLDPRIDRVTVYRTLLLLKRHALVDELDLLHLRGDGHFYERRPQRDHLHMACLRCGKVKEFESTLFERLKGEVQRECRFHILITRVEMGGYCAHCRALTPCIERPRAQARAS
jgi:Fur family ferric uptake transcriptional regulator